MLIKLVKKKTVVFNMYINQQDAQISVIRLYFLIICPAAVWLYEGLPITTQQPDVSEYTKCDVHLIKVAPDDGLT